MAVQRTSSSRPKRTLMAVSALFIRFNRHSSSLWSGYLSFMANFPDLSGLELNVRPSDAPGTRPASTGDPGFTETEIYLDEKAEDHSEDSPYKGLWQHSVPASQWEVVLTFLRCMIVLTTPLSITAYKTNSHQTSISKLSRKWFPTQKIPERDARQMQAIHSTPSKPHSLPLDNRIR